MDSETRKVLFEKFDIFSNSVWQDDLIWCPSQCYLYFNFGNKSYCVYLRWRHDDPWTADLVQTFGIGNTKNFGSTAFWQELDIDFWKDSELEQCKKNTMSIVKNVLYKN